MLVTSFYLPIVLAGTSTTVLSKNGESLAFIPDLDGSVFSVLPLSTMVDLPLSIL